MVLTKSELITSLKHEVHVLSHLAGKLDRSSVDYRPTPKQRSALELLQYLTVMGPELVKSAKAGAMGGASVGAAMQAGTARDFDQTLQTIAGMGAAMEALLADIPDAAFREEIEMFGNKSSRGAFLVNLVLCGYAAYRTQLFVYLKACGR